MTTKTTAAGAGATHPGQHVRDTVIAPKGMSVTEAAKILGVTRPALSNLLNGRVAATPGMASRIERAFGIPAQTLLGMQAGFDGALAKSSGVPASTRTYVPPFLTIKANDIETWASSSIPVRIRLPVLLRTLVNSTGIGLTKVEFPGNDDAERPGWDGFVEAAEGTPWIPEGRSGWEFGVNKDIKDKADGDFTKRAKATDKAARDQTTFVFVTPRRWKGKAKWIAENEAKGQWKDVRAYDSSDLEQWLEQSLAGQTWFANETDRPSDGVRSLDKCWSDWADIDKPPLSGALFQSAIDGAKRKLIAWLLTDPDSPTVIAADSTEEALAFLAQVFKEPDDDDVFAAHRDRVLVFDKPGVLPKLAQGTQHFIAVAPNRDVERELAPFVRSMHTIVVYPRNAVNVAPHVVLEPLHYETFRAALESMGYGRDDVDRYSLESGRSLTVLRRRLSRVPAVCTPEWAADGETAASLIPFLLVGAWNSSVEEDRIALTLLANEVSYETLEKNCQRLARLNDAPIWLVGTYRGVISKIDLLFAVAGSITTPDLERYFDMAKVVLGEDDPRLDLPEGERWAAALHGKSREFSAALRKGISETLVLLAVHGNHLFKGRLGFDAEAETEKLVRNLLLPITTRTLEANDQDLPTYAEAAPEAFLTILEDDLFPNREKHLADHQPACFGLLRPAPTDLFGGGCARTGLLWALEGLAWNPATLHRATLILARLAEVEIDDNWANKPIGSLKAIFRAWMPQTAANHDQRVAVMKLLAERFPMVAWKVCVEQFGKGHRTGFCGHKPRWRTDGHGFGETVPRPQAWAFEREMVQMALGWKNHTRDMLGDLIERLYDLTGEQQAMVWELVSTWAADASDDDKARIREKIRVSVMSRRGMKRTGGVATGLSIAAKAAYQALEPVDVLSKHEWLFRNAWVEESADEIHDDDLDFKMRDERIAKLRAEALREVSAARGMAGVIELAEMGKAASQIGALMAIQVLEEQQIPDFLLMALRPGFNDESWTRKNLISGALNALNDDAKRAYILEEAKKKLPSQADLARLLLLAPFRRSMWQMADQLDEAHRQTYWDEVTPHLWYPHDDDLDEGVERLLTAERPRAVFAYIHFRLEAIKPELLFRLMSDMAKGGRDRPDHHQLAQHDVEKAFSLFSKSPDLTLEQKAGLELAYIGVLAKPWSEREGYGIPNLETYLEAHPELFVRAVVWVCKRDGDGEDPSEWKVAPEAIEPFAERGRQLLEGIERVPGHDDLGELKADLLAEWVKTVRDACTELGRLEFADFFLGKLFSHAPEGKDGVWPCEPVRQVMEEIQSKQISEGARNGLYNARGMHGRGEGGGQERELAEEYRRWARALQYSHPFVASTVLMNMVKTYEHEASYWDTEAGIRRRLR